MDQNTLNGGGMDQNIMDERTRRLDQMKRSQNKLRLKRADEVNSLRHEIETLKSEKNNLQDTITDIAQLTQDCQYPNTLTNHKMKRMIKYFPAGHESYVSIDNFINLYDLNEPSLIEDDVFILKAMCRNMAQCFDNFLNNDKVVKMTLDIFKYFAIYGPGMAAQVLKHVDDVSYNDNIPNRWIDEKDSVPRGVLSIVDSLIYLKHHLDVLKRSFAILNISLLRYAKLTPYGFVYLQKDLDWCIQLSYSPKLDRVFLLEQSMCFHDVPEQLIRKLVKQ